MKQKTKQKLLIFVALLPFFIAFHIYAMPHIRIKAPALFGLQRLTSSIYIDPSMNRYEIWKTYKKIKQAETSIIEFFGSKHTHPMIIACKTASCFSRFGGKIEDNNAHSHTVNSDGIIRLNRSDISNRYATRFKLATLELQTRLGSPEKFSRLPVWFQEGLATYLAGDPRFGKLAWYQYIRSSPKAKDIQSLTTHKTWQKAQRQKIPVKILARQEFARWYDEAGQEGLLKFIEELRTGHPFKKAFAQQMLITLK